MSTIKLEHGSGGALSRELVEKIIFPVLQSVAYRELSDATQVICREAACLTTDSYVVDPLFFPGGDIGKLAVFGTCNDLAVAGAKPAFLTLAFIIEEGLPLGELKAVLQSVAEAAAEAKVAIVTGDTKVVPRGKGGGLYINTSGLGWKAPGIQLSSERLEPGDSVILSGPIGAHGIAVMAARESLPVAGSLRSDCAFLYPLCSGMFELGDSLKFMRDATRGGVAAVLNEIVSRSGILVRERDIPVEDDVDAVARLLGLSPIEVANEGVFVSIVKSDKANSALKILRSYERGAGARQIGEVTSEYPGKVVMETAVGGRRLLDLPRGLLLPRIC